MDDVQMTEDVRRLTKQMMENLNLVFGMALDGRQSFDEAEKRFRELTNLLEAYNCMEAAADQIFNFAKIAFFRGCFDRALAYAQEAALKCEAQEKRSIMKSTIHDMAFKLLDQGLSDEQCTEEQRKALLQLADAHLLDEDYQAALQNAVSAARGMTDPEQKRAAGRLLRRLALELLRRGINHKKQGEDATAILLMRQALPFLGKNQASAVQKEITLMEGGIHRG